MTTAPIGWIVDVQNDFMLPEGRLYVRDLEDPSDPGAIEARGRIEAAVEWMREHCEVLVYTGDWHGPDDPEIDPDAPDASKGTYPPHCMGRSDDPEEREGALILDSIRPESPVVLEVGAGEIRAAEVARRAVEEERPIFVRKTRFDVFVGNPATEAMLEALEEELGRELEIWIAGVARDVCVTGAVDGMLARGYRVVAVSDATWGLGLEPEAVTLGRWSSGGKGRVVETADLPR